MVIGQPGAAPQATPRQALILVVPDPVAVLQIDFTFDQSHKVVTGHFCSDASVIIEYATSEV